MSNLFIGVQTTDLPTISTTGISAASINTAGLEGYFERGATDGVYQITDSTTLFNKLGNYKSGYYGMYVAQDFIKNLQGQDGVLYVQRLKRTGSAASSATISDTQGSPADFSIITAGQLGKEDVGIWGNQLGYIVAQSSRYETTLSAATVSASPVISVTAIGNNPIGLMVNDWIVINGAVNKKIIAIDEVAGTVTLDSNVGSVIASNSTVVVRDFTIYVYMKDSATGNISLLETWANLSYEPLSNFYFVNRINSEFDGVGSNFIKVSDEVTTSPRTSTNFPATTTNTVGNITYLTGGIEGTALTETEIDTQRVYWRDAKPMYLANAEHFTEAMWDNGEAYCYDGGKGDITWVGSPTQSMVYSQAIAWANKRAKSRKVASLTVLNWKKVPDPLNSTSPDPNKVIPPVGAIMGYWIYATSLRGIHKVPAGRFEVLTNTVSIVGEITNRTQLRDLANAGMNCISNLEGVMTVRTARTFSKLPEWRFANALAMQTFFKRTFENAFQDLENETSSDALFQRVYSGMYNFARLMFESSTNGGSESAFASYIKADGSTSDFNDVVKIVVDETINTRQRVLDGELRANFYFMPPTPAERILVGVGLIYTIA